MPVRDDCRHYLVRTISASETVQRCRIDAAEASPFACPESCLFFERRAFIGAGWAQAPDAPMSNTADNLPPPGKPRKKGKGGRRS